MTFYGDPGRLYGDAAFPYGTSGGEYPRVSYGLLIDWDNDGAHDGNEAGRMTGWNCLRGRKDLINGSANGLQPVQPGKLMLSLNNNDGRFDAYNTGSPLYPNIKPGRKIQFVVMDTYSGTIYKVFTGEIQDIKPYASDKSVQISAVDAMQKMASKKTTIALNTNIKVSDALEAVLDSISFTDYEIDSLLDVIPYWWVNSQNATTAIQELCDTSFGTFFIAADGKAKYYKRQRSVSSVLNLTQDKLQKDVGQSQPWDVVRNNIDVIAHPMVRQATADLWTLRDRPSVPAGETIEIWGSFSYGSTKCPATGVINPAATTDYTMDTVEGGGGTDLTASFTVTPTIFGEAVKLEITNNSASLGYVTLMKIRGDALTMPDAVRVNKPDAASILEYGDKTFTLDSKWLQNTNLAIELAETIRDLLANPRRNPVIRIDTRPDIQYTADLFDRLSLAIAELGIDGAYRVGSIQHQSTGKTCQTVMTTITLEPVVEVTGTYWTFPTQIGVSSNFA